MSPENRYRTQEDIPCPRLQPQAFAEYLEMRQQEAKALGSVATLSLVEADSSDEFKQMAEFDMRPAMAV